MYPYFCTEYLLMSDSKKLLAQETETDKHRRCQIHKNTQNQREVLKRPKRTIFNSNMVKDGIDYAQALNSTKSVIA